MAGAVVKSNFRVILRKFTFALWMACLTTSLLNILFGYDTTSFSGVQAIPGFVSHFGTPTLPNGEFQISASRASFMSSVAFVGKLLGVLVGLSAMSRITFESLKLT